MARRLLPALTALVILLPAHAAGRPSGGMPTPIAREGAASAKLEPGPPKPAAVASSTSPSCDGADHAALGEDAPVEAVVASGEHDCYAATLPAEVESAEFRLEGPDGTSADLDLYVRHGAPVTSTAYDCRPYGSSSRESCPFAEPKSGTWYVMVHAAGTGGPYRLELELRACRLVEPGTPATGSLEHENDLSCERIEVPEDVETLVVDLGATDEDADIDLFVRYGAHAGPHAFDCRSVSAGNRERCILDSPRAGTWFAAAYAYAGSSDYAIEVTFDGPECTPLAPGTSGAGDAGAGLVDCWEVSAQDADLLEVATTSAADADLDLVVSTSREFGDPSSILCEAYREGPEERCGVADPGSGPWYVHVLPFEVSGSGAYSIGAEVSGAVDIAGTVTRLELTGPGDLALFRLPADESAAVIGLGSATDADFDLYTARAAIPRADRFECASTGGLTVETCAHLPRTGDVYVLVESYWGSGPADLIARALP